MSAHIDMEKLAGLDDDEAAAYLATVSAGVNPKLTYWPDEQEGAHLLAALSTPTSNHPKTDSDVVYVATRPLKIGAAPHANLRLLGLPDVFDVPAGSVLWSAEVEASRGALAAMVARGDVVALPVDSGIVAGVLSLARRLSRLEGLLQS